MKIAAISLALAIGLALASSALAADPVDPNFKAFQAFNDKYNVTYDSAEEFFYRYSVFLKNLERIASLRHRHKALTGRSGDKVFSVTKFAHLTPDEFKATYLGYKPRKQMRSNAPHGLAAARAPVTTNNVTNLPSEWDWRNKGVVTDVKDQGQCGSCWAFSATEEIESMWAMSGHPLTVLSEQQIVSCDTVDQGCDGGNTETAYEYVHGAGGLETENAYPYTSGDGDSGYCNVDSSQFVVTVQSYTYATTPCQDSCDHQDETTLANNLVQHGPVSICVDAESWQYYGGGVLQGDCPHAYDDLDHCVQLVGYNAQTSPAYWIVRNSWNTDWGEDGFIYLEMGMNLCGVANDATFAWPASVSHAALN